ncbi:putative pantothenate transporter [Diaporthe sp. PMI_573]|nr:putative pantothenate transporter [Diaporthaceae sp. PMI_573]
MSHSVSECVDVAPLKGYHYLNEADLPGCNIACVYGGMMWADHALDAVFVKYLDQTNISNAYVSGLKEDFSLNGNELNYFNVCYTTAYVVFQVPGMLLLSRPKLARWLLPTLEVLWGLVTFAQSRATTVHQLYALRFLVGMFEAPVFAGTHFILGSWYSGPELFRRAGTWFICNPLGSMISGYLQAAAYTNLSGVGDLAGWQWLFIIDGIFTIPVALLGYVVFPGIPDSPRPFYLTEDDISLAQRRLEKFRIRRPGKLGLDVVRRTLRRWHIWVFVFCYICMIISSYPSQYMNLWLKAEEFSTVQVNELPTGVYAIQALASWLGATLAAIYPSWAIYSIETICVLFSTICMVVWNIPKPLKFFAWYLFGVSGCASPILYSTVNSIVRDDSEERAIIMGSMMTFGYSFQIWVPLLIFPTAGPYGAPRWQHGWPVTLVFYFLLWTGFITALMLQRRGEKHQQADLATTLSGAEDTGRDIVSVETPVDSKANR